ncbi:MAG: VOC family protein [Chloroflexi bacterium]|nr:VOC family protein [Chloroflexota bacterium]
MRIEITGVFVDNQDKALKFYTDILGFLPKHDIPVGAFRWLTVVSPENPDGVELLLEPNDNPASSTFQQAIFEQGIPAHMFSVDDIQSEVDRLKDLGVEFFMEPTDAGQVTIAIFNDTCGNLIQIMQTNET